MLQEKLLATVAVGWPVTGKTVIGKTVIGKTVIGKTVMGSTVLRDPQSKFARPLRCTLLHRLYYTDFSTKKTLDCRHEVGLFLVMARDRGLRLDTDAHKHCYHI